MPRSKKNRKFLHRNQNPHNSISSISGFIFLCDHLTKAECFRSQTFGLPLSKIDLVHKIQPGTYLFLFDCKLKLLYGAYRAVSHGGANLVPSAFGGKFPAQVRFRVEMELTPLHESVFKHAIEKNYVKSKFQPELNLHQVDSLLSLFQAGTMPQPAALPPISTIRPPRQAAMSTNLAIAPSQQILMSSSSENIQYQQSVLQPSQVYNQYHATPPQFNQEIHAAPPNSGQQYYAAPPHPGQQYYVAPQQSFQQHYAPAAQPPLTQHLSQFPPQPNYQQYDSNANYLQPPPLTYPGTVAASVPCHPGSAVPA